MCFKTGFIKLSGNIIEASILFFHFSQQRIRVFQTVLEDRTMTQSLTLAYLVIFSSIITLTTSQQNCRLTTRDVEGPFYESGKY